MTTKMGDGFRTLWFGESWHAPICDPENKVDTPLNSKCTWCDEGFDKNSQGVRVPCAGLSEPPPEPYTDYHANCFLRTVIGSLGHLQKKCHCFGGNEEDPPDMTQREAANAAVEYFRKHGP